MKIPIRRIGNSQGIIIPKPLLIQLGIADEIDMEVSEDRIVLRKPSRPVRVGWAEESRKIAAAGEDALVWPEFANEADSELEW
jgi:antitoxin MazE